MSLRVTVTGTMSDWTPVAKARARLLRAEAEEHGSMQHFTTALHLADVVIKLHTLTLVAIVEQQRPGLGSSLSFDLSRAASTGSWVQALQRAVNQAQPFGLNDAQAAWLVKLKTWLTQRKRREDEDRLTPVLSEALELVDALKREAGESSARDAGRTPIDLMNALVEIRNKTTGHRAYGSDFWARHTPTASSAVGWLANESPLWRGSLLLPVTRQGRTVCRLLQGVEPTSTVSAPSGLDVADVSSPVLALDQATIAPLGDLIFVDPATNLTYIANGTWRDSDSSAEFLCHSLEASEPAQGSIRRELATFAIKPRELPASETQGEPTLLAAAGTVLNNLPADVQGYVQRGDLEERMRSYIFDSRRRHVINVRGPGGFGKTSLLLRLCHELVSDEAHSPYVAVVWMSARDVDLMMSGAVPVRRSEESIEEVWIRFASLFDEETDLADARDFFESSMRKEAILVILDNFETFNNQEAAYAYLDELVQPPAKAIITSRHVFTGDSPLEVRGMSQQEADQLLVQAARAAGVEPLMTDRVRSRIFERCQGHPYAMKLIASQVRSEAGLTGLLTKVIRNEDLLDALFRGSLEDLGYDDDAVFVFLLVGQFAAGLSEQALRVAAEPDSIDVDRAVDALTKRSLLDVVGRSGAVRYDMPAMAREFAQRHLVGHLLRTEVEGTAEFLWRWPALVDGRTSEAAELMLAELVNRDEDSVLRQRIVSALRVLTSFDDAVWVHVARGERTIGSPHSVWESTYKRAVEAAPDRADLLFEWSEATPEPDRQVELKVQAVRADSENIALASRVANFLNGLYSRDRGRYQPVRWSALMGAVIDALEGHFPELDGEALSRLAWLYIHAGRASESRRVIERGLAVDFENQSLRRLASRQKIRV
jgi:hypothetical protein